MARAVVGRLESWPTTCALPIERAAGMSVGGIERRRHAPSRSKGGYDLAMTMQDPTAPVAAAGAASDPRAAAATVDAIMHRATAKQLGEPGPGRVEIETLLAAGARAPDHGRLEPWRFVVLEGDARDVIAASMAAIARAGGEDDDERVMRAAAKAYRAPVIIVVGGVMKPAHKVPEVEQLLAVGAAIENMLIAAESLGIGSMWKTGAPAYDPALKAALGLAPDDHICGFLYLGAVVTPGDPYRPRPSKATWLGAPG